MMSCLVTSNSLHFSPKPIEVSSMHQSPSPVDVTSAETSSIDATSSESHPSQENVTQPLSLWVY